MSEILEAQLPSSQRIPPRENHSEAGLGLLYGIAAYTCWGLVPIYFKSIEHVAAHTILAHRIAWSALFLLLIVAVKSRWNEVVLCVRHRNTLALLCASTVAIALNWYIYIWAVSHKQVIGASLGYFINPLVTVMLGMIVLGERLRRGQIAALLLAGSSVCALMIAEHHVPIIALGLAASFATYGLLRKQAVVAPTIGLFVETLILLAPALVVIAISARDHPADGRTYFLLSLSGLVTAVPLICFAAAARRLRLSTMGFLHYLTPTGQFLLGRFAYHEPFDRAKFACFAGVWIALIIFTIDSLHAYRRSRTK